MSTPAAPASGGVIGGWFKTVAGGTVGLASGVAMMYATAIVDKVVKPPKPMANFSTKADGLTVTCDSKAIGESGWWDFGDGSALEPFDATKPNVTHAYAKPGNFNIKLTVRNFLAEENDRTVPVEVGTPAAAATASASATAPAAQLTVTPVSPNPTAPATFRVTGQVTNADKAFLDVVSPGVTQAGGAASPNRIQLSPAGGVIETLIVVDKPGQHAIQLFGQKGNEVIKQAAFVTVAAPQDGAVAAYLRVTDTGTKTVTRRAPTTVPVPLPAKGAPKTFEKVLTGLPGFQIQDAKITSALSKAATGIKATIAPDKQTVKLSGEWAGAFDTVARLAGGSDLMVMLELTFVRQEQVVVPTTVTLKLLGASGTATLPPLPVGLSNPQRQVDLELCVYQHTGERTVMTTGQLTPGTPLRKPITWGPQKFLMDATLTGQQATVTLNKG